MNIESIYKQYHRRLSSIVYTQLGSLELADEIVQRTFLSLLLNKYRHQCGTSVTTWLIQLLKWEIAEYCKESYNQVQLEALPEWDEIGAELGIEPIDIEKLVDISLAIKRLPIPLCKLAIEYFLEGYTEEELAIRSGKSVRTIQRMLSSIYRRFERLIPPNSK